MNMSPKNMAEYEVAMAWYEKHVKPRTDLGPMAKFSQLPYCPAKPPDLLDPMNDFDEEIQRALDSAD